MNPITNDLHFDVIVVGGGASGMMAAGRAAERGKRVLLIEKNGVLGTKLSISGGGRCNITNAEYDLKTLLQRYGTTEQFLYSPFSRFGVEETFDFFESRGLPLVIEAGKRTFPKTQQASDVVQVLEAYVGQTGVDVLLGTPVRTVQIKDNRVEKIEAGGRAYTAENFIFATGGLSHPETGSTGDGFAWLRELGFSIVTPTPTIVPLKTREKWTHQLSGLSVPDVKLTFISQSGKKIARSGPLLFTHFGISGPTVLNAAGAVSDQLHEGAVFLTIDLFPTQDIGTLDDLLVTLFVHNRNRLLKNVFAEFIPSALAEAILAQLPMIDARVPVHSVTKASRRMLIDAVKRISLSVTGLMGFDKAVVADGGLPLEEVHMKTMRTKRYENLFVTGDLLHVTRPSGGYSLQLCWTTGYIAGDNA